MLADVPLGKQIDLALQQRGIIRRQHARFAGQLPGDQGIDRVAEQRVGIVFSKPVQISGGAQVAQQQKPALDVLRQHVRHVQARVAHQGRHVDERAAVFLRRRRVHGD